MMQLSVLQVCVSQTKEKEKAASLEMCLEELPTVGKWSVETNGKRERVTSGAFAWEFLAGS